MRSSVLAASAVVSTLFTLLSADASAADTPSGAVATPPSEERSGNFAEISTGASYFGGEYAKGARAGAFEIVVSFRGGHYFGRHLGLVTGLDLGHGFLTTGCTDMRTGKESKECDSWSASVPLAMQYAFVSRSRGAWIEAGAALGKTHAVMAANGAAVFVSPADVAVGFGTRLPFVAERGAAPRTLDFAARAQAGMFTWGSASIDGTNASGLVLADYRAMHYAVTLSMGYQF